MPTKKKLPPLTRTTALTLEKHAHLADLHRWVKQKAELESQLSAANADREVLCGIVATLQGERDFEREQARRNFVAWEDAIENATAWEQNHAIVRDSRKRLVALVRRKVSHKIYARVFIERNEARNELAQFRAEGYTMVLNNVRNAK